MSRPKSPEKAARNRQIVKDYADGNGPTYMDLARKYGVSSVSIGQILREAGVTKRKRRTECIHVFLSEPHRKALTEEAYRRGIKPARLVNRLLQTIVDDNMFKAVLDD